MAHLSSQRVNSIRILHLGVNISEICNSRNFNKHLEVIIGKMVKIKDIQSGTNQMEAITILTVLTLV